MPIVTQGSCRRGQLDLMEAVFAAISVQSLVHAPRAVLFDLHGNGPVGSQSRGGAALSALIAYQAPNARVARPSPGASESVR
jgi:hypothetical protein